jgi:hypothetical protein
LSQTYKTGADVDRIGLSSVGLSLIVIFSRRCMSDLWGLDLACMCHYIICVEQRTAPFHGQPATSRVPFCDPRRVHVVVVVIVAPNCLFAEYLHLPVSIMLCFYSSVTDAVLVVTASLIPRNSSRLVKKLSFVEPEVLLCVSYRLSGWAG